MLDLRPERLDFKPHCVVLHHLHLGLADERFEVFWAGYRNAITIRAFAIATSAALTVSHSALAHIGKMDESTVQTPTV